MFKSSRMAGAAIVLSLGASACTEPNSPEPGADGGVDISEPVRWLAQGDGRACGHFSITQTITAMVSVEDVLERGFSSLRPGLEDGDFFLEHLSSDFENITLESVDSATSSVTCSADYIASFGENPPATGRITYSVQPTIDKADLLIEVDDLTPMEDAIRSVATAFLAEGRQMAAAPRTEGGDGGSVFLHAEPLPEGGLAEWRGRIVHSEGTHRTMAVRTERPVEVTANVSFTCEDSVNTSWSDVRRAGVETTVEQAGIPPKVLTMALRHGCNW